MSPLAGVKVLFFVAYEFIICGILDIVAYGLDLLFFDVICLCIVELFLSKNMSGVIISGTSSEANFYSSPFCYYY